MWGNHVPPSVEGVRRDCHKCSTKATVVTTECGLVLETTELDLARL